MTENSKPILDFFFEKDCPFCRRVRINIIDKLTTTDMVIINPVDVDTNLGSLEKAWYDIFCRKTQSEPTPLLRLHDSSYEINNYEYVFLMWKKKPTTLTQEVLSSEEYLEKQIYDKIRLIEKTQHIEVQPSYEMERDTFLLNKGMGLDARIY